MSWIIYSLIWFQQQINTDIMKIRCPLCGKILPRFENVLTHIKRVHTDVAPDTRLELAYTAEIVEFSKHKMRGRGYKKSIQKQRDILLGKTPKYKSSAPHSIYWGAVIKTPCGKK